MQLYALDEQNQPVFANHAHKQKDYSCVECGSAVRLRGGLHRQNHFYHVMSDRACVLNGKSMEHLQVQCFLQGQLPPDEGLLEHRFPSIGRIADVLWKSAGIVFEIQCSPISAEEVRCRNRDYASLGLRVVWILHDARYNQWRVTAAELLLQAHPHYYTNIDAAGKGEFYDQLCVIRQGIRVNALPPLSINMPILYQLKLTERQPLKALEVPKILRRRLEAWPLCFEGDLLHLYVHSPDSAEMQAYLARILALEAEEASPERGRGWKMRIATAWRLFVVRPYRHLFQLLLERACK